MNNDHRTGEQMPDKRQNWAETKSARISGVACSFEHPREPGEAELAWLAGRQEWCLHRRQLLAGGLGRHAILTRVNRGTLHPLLTDVYLWGRAQPEPLSMAMAVALHLRGDALISGAFAVWIWGMIDERPELIEVALAGRNARGIPGVTIKRVPNLETADIRRRKGLPVVSPARALVEFAAAASRFELESAMAMLRRKGLATDKEVEAVLDRMPLNRPGVKIVRHLLAVPAGSLAALKSDYERKLRRLCRLADLQAPLSNIRPEGFEVDLCWPQQKLIVEFDGWEFHKQKFKADRRRDAHLQARGWRVIRFTADDVDLLPYVVVAQLAAALTLVTVAA
jgi:very-short-patch-repair endonuclease